MVQEILASFLKDRPRQVEEARKNGVKTVAYFPGGFVPEELIYAAGAIPLCLVEGGSATPVKAASSIMAPVICPFARAQFGERLLKRNPYYQMIDMLVAPISCQHLKKLAEVWEYYGDMEIFKLGVPHQFYSDQGLEYYLARLGALKERLERLTGNEITTESIRNSIELYNRLRLHFKELSLLRKLSPPPLNSLDFARLNHASFYADPAVMVELLSSIRRRLGENQPPGQTDKMRLLLIGPNLACGDYRILECIEKGGGEVVIEEVCECIRYYWESVENTANPLEALAKAYLRDKLPCAFMRYASRQRLDFALKLISDFRVSGVIWYELQYCETYDSESYFFAQKMNENNIPLLVIESDYGDSTGAQIQSRIDAFIELLRGDII